MRGFALALIIGLALLSGGTSTAEAQTKLSQVRLVCVVFPQYVSMRSRPYCELSYYQPPGTSCACPSYSSQGQRVLPGRVQPAR
jgi:hypothetical protein